MKRFVNFLLLTVILLGSGAGYACLLAFFFEDSKLCQWLEGLVIFGDSMTICAALTAILALSTVGLLKPVVTRLLKPEEISDEKKS